MCTDLVFFKSPFKNTAEIPELYFKYLGDTLCKREYHYIKFPCIYFLGKTYNHYLIFTESSSSEIIEDNQVTSVKYCAERDRYRWDPLQGDGWGFTFDNNLRINLLDNHFKPDKNFEFPRKLLHGCKRSFSHNLIMKYSFLAYSRHFEALFCLSCVLFSKNKGNNFKKIPSFSKWYKTGEKVEVQCSSSVNDRSMSRLEEFKERFQNPQSTIPYTTDKTLPQRVEHNTEVLRWIIEVVILFGKQCLPLRGHRENFNDSSHNTQTS